MKNKRLLLFIFLLCFIRFFISCGPCSKTVDCPAYKDDLLDAWFPYADGDRLFFRSTQNENDTATLKNTLTSEAYQQTASLERAVICTAGKTFQSEQRDTAGSFQFYLQLTTGENGRGAQLYLQRTNVDFSGFSETLAPQVKINLRTAFTQPLQNVQIGNRNFANLIEATLDTSDKKFSGIYKLYFAKGEGILGYSLYPSRKTWVKQ